AADADHRDAAREFGQPLLELLAIVIRGGFLDLCLDLGNTPLDIALLTGTVDDRGVLLVDHQLLGLAEHGERGILELNAEIFANRLAAGHSIALRRSPKPGALTAATLRPPRSLLTTRVASASPS